MRRLLFAVVLLASAQQAGAVAYFPPDNQRIEDLTPVSGGFVVTWVRLDKSVTVLQATFASDGTLSSDQQVIFTGDANRHRALTAASSLVAWQRDTGEVVVSPIADGTLTYPNGKVISPDASEPMVACSATRCAALWREPGTLAGAFIDADGNAAGDRFQIPETSSVLRMIVDESGLFIVRSFHDETRATLIDATGMLLYDAKIMTSAATIVPASAIDADYDGASHVVVWIEKPRAEEPSLSVQAAIVRRDGSVTTTVHPLLTVSPSDSLDSIAIGWNGEQHLVACSFGPRNRVSVGPFNVDALVVPMNDQLELSEANRRTFKRLVSSAMPFRIAGATGIFALAWQMNAVLNPAIGAAVIDGAGTMSAPLVLLEPGPGKRRSARAH